jgi:hypothetical protein
MARGQLTPLFFDAVVANYPKNAVLMLEGASVRACVRASESHGLRVRTCMIAHAHIHTHTPTNARTHTKKTHTHTNLFTHARTHPHTHTHKHTHTHAHTHAHARTLPQARTSLRAVSPTTTA